MKHTGYTGKSFARGAWRRGWMAALVLMGGLPGVASGCGLSWSEPRSHFDGVDSEGHVMLVEKLGEIELEAGAGETPAMRLPVYAMFGSEFTGVSPYVGYGWKLPILETRVVQADENTFKLEEPAGWYRMFYRDKKEPQLLTGGGGWKAWIEGEKITAWADCGAKLVFRRGKIEMMELNGRRLEYVYENGVATEIREGGRTLLRVRKDAKSGEVNGLVFAGGKEAGIELGDRPRVEIINGKPVVGRMERALGRVPQGNGGSEELKYSVSGSLTPTLKMGDREIAWNAASGLVERDGNWTYSVASKGGAPWNVTIARQTATGARESWSRDNARGEETIERLDGSKTTWFWFASGPLAGRKRKIIVQAPDGAVRYEEANIYSEDGRLLRRTMNEAGIGWRTEERHFPDGTSTSIATSKGGSTIISYKDIRGYEYATTTIRTRWIGGISVPGGVEGEEKSAPPLPVRVAAEMVKATNGMAALEFSVSNQTTKVVHVRRAASEDVIWEVVGFGDFGDGRYGARTLIPEVHNFHSARLEIGWRSRLEKDLEARGLLEALPPGGVWRFSVSLEGLLGRLGVAENAAQLIELTPKLRDLVIGGKGFSEEELKRFVSTVFSAGEFRFSKGRWLEE